MVTPWSSGTTMVLLVFLLMILSSLIALPMCMSSSFDVFAKNKAAGLVTGGLFQRVF
jgi:hypothetical protein